MIPASKLSGQQMKAIHVYLRNLAEAFNDAGYDLKMVLEHKAVSVPMNEHLSKEVLWRPIQEAVTGKHSTTELNTAEPGEIYKILDRHIAEKFGISVPFPHENDNG